MAGTDHRRVRRREAAPAVVLAAPQMGENIGAAARAMLNFGLTELRLAAPRDGWPNDKARAMASGADSVIDGARVFDGLAEAIADQNYVAVTTARRRDLLKPVITPSAAAREMRARAARGEKCALVFGGERAGLSADDVAAADAIITIPTNPGFSSLNLGQAVLLVAYHWLAAAPPAPEPDALRRAAPASKADLEGLFAHLENALTRAGYFFPPEKTPIMRRNLRALFARAGLTEQETRSFRGVIKALEKGRATRD